MEADSNAQQLAMTKAEKRKLDDLLTAERRERMAAERAAALARDQLAAKVCAHMCGQDNVYMHVLARDRLTVKLCSICVGKTVCICMDEIVCTCMCGQDCLGGG